MRWSRGSASRDDLPQKTAALAGAFAGCLAGTLWLLRRLAGAPGARQDEHLIAGLAIIGRGVILLLLAHLSMLETGWPGWRNALVIGGLGVLTAGMAASMVRHGPVTRSTAAFLQPAAPQQVLR